MHETDSLIMFGYFLGFLSACAILLALNILDNLRKKHAESLRLSVVRDCDNGFCSDCPDCIWPENKEKWRVK